MKTKKVTYAAIFYLFMLLLAAFFFFPMIWMAYSGFKDNITIFTTPFALPKVVDWNRVAEAWRIANIGIYARNSVIVTSVSVVCVLIFASAAAYAFGRMKFRFKGLLQGILVIGLFIPVQSFFIAQFWIVTELKLTGSYWALILPYIAMGVSLPVFLLTAYFKSLPKEIEESALIDGANHFTIYRKIMLPMVSPGMITVGIFTTLGCWNEFLLALFYIQDPNLQTVTLGMFNFSGKHHTDYAMMFLGLSMVTLPMILVYFIFNKSIATGLTEGSLKG